MIKNSKANIVVLEDCDLAVVTGGHNVFGYLIGRALGKQLNLFKKGVYSLLR
ncbi:hypothetical protein G6R29_05265 [Fructobacillus sp. M2-14]|uniref:Uncharacterized protein n=1 Tax=Fructobacillus broussonetiae TaxID=2713173 RepID=A0ABS5R386_9LACO|nr:hypothetical protein [Fructobacillus broussonetiae]MBS9339029.1 hypothetical protein [Fructobacillus broussonetiae]